jgi:hypothetical protein
MLSVETKNFEPLDPALNCVLGCLRLRLQGDRFLYHYLIAAALLGEIHGGVGARE